MPPYAIASAAAEAVDNAAVAAAPTGAAPTDFNATLNPAEQANTAAAAKLLREILDYQQRLKRLQSLSSGGQDYLIRAYRRSIQVRRQLLADLPQPIDRSTPSPWRH